MQTYGEAGSGEGQTRVFQEGVLSFHAKNYVAFFARPCFDERWASSVLEPPVQPV